MDAMISEHHHQQQQQLSRKALPLGSSLLSSEPGERRSIFGSLTGAEIQSSLLAAAERRAVFGMQGEAPAALAMEAERRALLAGCLMEARDPLFGGGGISGEGRAEAERRLEQELRILAAGGDRSCAARGHSGSAEGHDATALQAGERHEPEQSPMHLKESSLMATRSDDSDQDGSMTPDTDCGATTSQGGETEQETSSSSRQYPPAAQPTGPQLVSPLLLPFGMAGVGSALGSAAGQAVGVGPQQGMVLTLPAASLANMQGLAAAAAAASGILALPLHNMQATSSLNAQIQQLHQLQQLQQQQQQQQQQHQQQQQQQPQTQQAKHGASPRKSSSAANPSQPPSSQGSSLPLVGGPLTSPAAVAAVAAAVAASGSLPPSAHIFAGALAAGLPGVAGQLITNAQGQLIGTIPLVGGGGSGTGAAGMGATGLPLSPQLLTNTQGQVVAMLVGNQILPVLNPQGLTLSSMKAPGQQQVHGQQGGQGSTPPGLLHVVPPGPGSLAHGQGGLGQSPGSSAPQSLSPSSPSVGQLVNNPQGPCGEVDGVNLEEMREFARAFKIRRLSLGLTQTQVGQALSAAEGPAYSQSAICRFEKLDITPKSAQKIKPVLERWMEEAEARKQAGLQSLSDFVGGEPSKKRKRRTSFTPQALELLNAHFERNTHPSGQEMTAIAERLCYDREVVRVWFCNKRQALKNTIKRLKQHDPATPPPPLPPPPPPALPTTPQSLVVPQPATGLPKVVVTEPGPGTFEHAALSQGLTKIPAEEESSHGFD